jgi:hypothetical protein
MGSESVMRPLGSVEGEVERRIHALASRTEERIARAVAVQLSTLDGSPSAEEAFTENVSVRGARVVTKQHWKPEERVLLKSLESQARVMYCQHLTKSVFAVGLDLVSPAGEWGKPC